MCFKDGANQPFFLDLTLLFHLAFLYLNLLRLILLYEAFSNNLFFIPSRSLTSPAIYSCFASMTLKPILEYPLSTPKFSFCVYSVLVLYVSLITKGFKLTTLAFFCLSSFLAFALDVGIRAFPSILLT